MIFNQFYATLTYLSSFSISYNILPSLQLPLHFPNIQFDSLRDPNCRGPTAASCIDKNTENPPKNSIELWNDVFIHDAMNGSKIALIFINFKTFEGQSEFLSRQLSALSSFLSSIYFFMGEKELYEQHFGNEVRKILIN